MRKKRMEINSKKTKCMIFNKTGRFFEEVSKWVKRECMLQRHTNTLDFIQIPWICVNPSGEISTGLRDLNYDFQHSCYQTMRKSVAKIARTRKCFKSHELQTIKIVMNVSVSSQFSY